MLELKGVSRSWGDFCLRDVSFHISAGEFFVLLGPSGAGKSLLVELIAGFHRPERGSVRIAERDVTWLPPEQRSVGFVCQDPLLFAHQSVGRNIAYGPRARGLSRAEARKRVEEVTSLLGLESLLERNPEDLSGGEKRRVSLARALAVDPDLLLLDEPFTWLDAPVRREMQEEMKALQQRTGVTVLHVTHDRTEAVALAKRMAVMRDGRIQQVGSDLAVFEQPNSHFVAEFTGGRNIYTGRARQKDDVTEFASGDLKLVSTVRMTGPCRAVVRPENIIVSPEPVATSARNQLPAVVESVNRRGDVFEVAGKVGDRRMSCVVTPLSVEQLELEPGREVYFSFKAGNLHLFCSDSELEQTQ